jgi:hypothetical protein
LKLDVDLFVVPEVHHLDRRRHHPSILVIRQKHPPELLLRVWEQRAVHLVRCLVLGRLVPLSLLAGTLDPNLFIVGLPVKVVVAN